MTSWRVVSANSTTITFFEGVTRYAIPWGGLESTTESVAQMRTRQDLGHSYTLANLYVRVSTNNTDNASTIRSRRNALDGNQSVSFAANTSGVEEDTVNTDLIVADDLINSEVAVGAGSAGDALVLSIISYTFTDNAVAPQSFAGTGGLTSLNFASTAFSSVHGKGDGVAPAIGIRTVYLVRAAATVDRLRVFVSSNSVDGSTTFDFQINQVDTSQDLIIPALTSGEFEETVIIFPPTAVASGDLIRYAMVAAGTVGSLTVQVTQVRMGSTVRDLASDNASATSAIQRPHGITCFGALEEGGEGGGAGDAPFWNVTESIAEITPRIAMEVENLVVGVLFNDLDQSTTVALRVNGSNSLLSAAVPASATGFFEDTVNTIAVVATDTVNYILDTSLSTAGNITLVICGVATQQRIRGRTGVALGLIVRDRVG